MAAEGITGGESTTRISWREAAAGGGGAIVTLAAPLVLGMLAFAALGASAAGTGIPAAFIATAIGGLVFAVGAHGVMPAAAPSAATALIVAGVVAELAADPAMRSGDPRGIALILCAVSLCAIGMGLVQIAFALLRAGAFAKFVPQPVIAGFMTGVAILILVTQLPLLLGIGADAGNAVSAASGLPLGVHPVAITVGLATALVVWTIASRAPRLPGALLGLFAGAALDAALRYGASGIASSPLVGWLPVGVPLPFALAPVAGSDGEVLLSHLPTIATASLLLAIVGSIESLHGAGAGDEEANRSRDANRDLLALGFGNIASGLFGGLPVSYLRGRADAIREAGGRTWHAAAAAAVASWILFALGAPLFALLPLAVVAGLLLTYAVGVIDRWTRELFFQLAIRSRTRDTWTSLALLALVCGITLWLGIAAGVASAALASMLVFMRAMSRSPVHSRHTALAEPSRRAYLRAQEDELRPLRAKITIVSLDGALFFGNVDRLRQKCEALPHGTRFVIVDLTRVTTIDTAGANALMDLAERLGARSIKLLLSGISAGNRHGRTLLSLGGAEMYDSTRRWFPDVDHAVEVAERGLLGATLAATTVATVPFEQCALVEGMSAQQIDVVRTYTTERTLAPQELLFREGQEGDALFVLTRGSVTMVYAGDGRGARQRFVSFSPGMLFGEVALLDRLNRHADAVADIESVVHELTRERLDALRSDDPELCVRVYANIAKHLAERLRSAAGAWSASVR